MKHIIVIILLCCCISFCRAQIGLDATFGNNGMVADDSMGISSIALQYDGKIVIAGGSGYLMASRYMANGVKDLSFGTRGYFRSIPDTNHSSGRALCIVIQQNGRVLLGGRNEILTPPNGIPIRSSNGISLLADGAIDTAFGRRGYLEDSVNVSSSSPFKMPFRPNVVALQSDGKIIMGEDLRDLGLQLLRYHPDGTIDSSFGINGHAHTSNGYFGGDLTDMAVMADGRIVIGGGADPGNIRQFMAMRFLPNGQPDTTLDHTGKLYRTLGQQSIVYGRAMALQPDGKILLAGSEDEGLVWRFNADGTDDTTFNHTGRLTLSGHAPARLLVQPDGKILVGCYSGPFGDYDYGFIRLLPNGAKDLTFGNNGVYTLDNQQKDDRISCMIQQPDGKIVFVGNSDGKNYIYRLTLNATAVPEIPGHATGYTVYPNPASGQLYVQRLQANGQKAAIQLLDITGRILRHGTMAADDGLIALPLTGLTNGIYMIAIKEYDNSAGHYRVVVQQ